MTSCPFMAMHSATESAHGSDSRANEFVDNPSSLACPVSGRRAFLDHGSGKSLDDDNGWYMGGKQLNVIKEDSELETAEQELDNGRGESSPRGSLAGSLRSLRSLSQGGSVASGINAKIPGGSRCISSCLSNVHHSIFTLFQCEIYNRCNHLQGGRLQVLFFRAA